MLLQIKILCAHFSSGQNAAFKSELRCLKLSSHFDVSSVSDSNLNRKRCHNSNSSFMITVNSLWFNILYTIQHYTRSSVNVLSLLDLTFNQAIIQCFTRFMFHILPALNLTIQQVMVQYFINLDSAFSRIMVQYFYQFCI